MFPATQLLRVRAALALIGFTAVIAQIVLLRELMVVFSGNEISLGIVLANWLLWTAAGSGIAPRLGARALAPRSLVAGLEIAGGIAFPLSILAVRASKYVFPFVPGELLGPGPMFLTTLVALSLFCIISGWLFAAGSRLLAEQRRADTATATGSVYLLEAFGSAAGGVLASIVLIRWLDPFAIASLLALLNFLAAAALLWRWRSRRAIVAAAVVGGALVLLVPMAGHRLERASLAWLWRGFDLMATRNSVYGHLAVVRTEDTRSLFENGLVLYHAPDEAAAEEAVHYALLEHEHPRSLLLIGGGVDGSLAQALQHSSLERVEYVELDPEILRLARRYFPEQWKPIATDRRVQVHNIDGRLFLKLTPRRFDVIIVNLPEPQTAQLNRFYTVEFFREAAGKLAPGGVLSFQLKASENYISPELAGFLRCINQTLRSVFADVKAIPGDTVHFFAARRSGILTTDPAELVRRLRQRRLRTLYVREYYLPFRMMPDRMQELESQIRPEARTPVNRDFAPIAYYFDLALWSTQFHHASGRLFQRIAAVKFSRLAGAVAILAFVPAILLGLIPGRRRHLQAGAGLCLAAMGFTMIGLEILLLLGFQAIYGYVYHQLAMVIAAFMTGMALGSWLALRRSSGTRCSARAATQRLVILQVLAAVSAVALYGLFVLLAGVSAPAGLFVVSQLVFPGLALAAGLLGGYQFPLASRIYFAAPARQGSAGTPYAFDLAGACLGAVALSAWLVPIYGFLETALLMGLVNLGATALIALAARRAGNVER